MSDEAGLRAYFRVLARAEPPPPMPERRRDPKDRDWPAPKVPVPEPDAKVLSRHPAFTALFADAPVRKIGRSSRSASRGRQTRFPSLKVRRHMRLRSRLEYRHALISEMDDEITRFCEEPVVLRYRLGNRLATHRVDAFVQTAKAAYLVEIKYERDAGKAENEARWPWIAKAVNGLGLGYRVLTEHHVVGSLRAETVATVYEHRMAPLPEPGRLREVMDFVVRRGIARAGEIVEAFGDCVDLATVYALARHGYLAVDIDVAAGPDMGVWKGQGPFRKIGLASEVNPPCGR